MYKRTERENDEMRRIKVEKNFIENSYSSALISFGKTKVLCTASVDKKTPPFVNEEEMGWLTAEYNMLPGSTLSRKSRSTIKPDSRGIEIQRLIARALRAAIDLTKIKGYSIIVDCDVLQADGGTRTASITGGYIALALAVKRMFKETLINESPLTNKVAAISAGLVNSEVLLDINYAEDSRAEVDFNVIMDDNGKFIEVQGTAEKESFSDEQLLKILNVCKKGINELFKIQESALI